MFLLINVTFLQKNCMTKFKLCSKVIVEEMRGKVITLQPTRVVEIRKEEEITSPSQEITKSKHSGRNQITHSLLKKIVKQML